MPYEYDVMDFGNQVMPFSDVELQLSSACDNEIQSSAIITRTN